jgi:thermostable 8-oxoguanine DNA glycosylase
VKKKGSVLDVMDDRKQELKAFLKKNKINYKDDREKAIVRLAEYYDSLKK